VTAQLDRLIEALSRPELYPHQPQSIHVIQTHSSVIFLAGDLVYKVKKPIDLGFLDFTTLEKRKYYCAQEVRLNSRFSEGVYLGVVPIHRSPQGINLRGEGEEIDVAVLMKHLPEERMLLTMLRNDRVTLGIVDLVADRVAYLHSHAPTGPEISRFGAPGVIRYNAEENFEQTRPYIGRTIDEQSYEELVALTMEFLESKRSLFGHRVREGFIRDCHGDLHLEHVVILNGIILYDCIEFNDRFRYGDTAADLAFLLMDLDFRGFPAFADRMARRYHDSSGDPHVMDLLDYYKSYRALVRGKVLSFTLDEPEVSDAEKEAARAAARDYFALALSYLKPAPGPTLIITNGLSASGKSYLAERLALRIGLEPIRSDVIRKEIHNVEPTQHRLDKYGEGIYTSGATERTYEALLEAARRQLIRGQSVILDAAFGSRLHREKARQLANQVKAGFRIVECSAPESVLHARLRQRMESTDDPSDARLEILEHQKSDFEPVEDSERAYCRTWDSTTDLYDFLKRFVRELITSP
jgi:aminoglycoside phosphotransferase family enzyme/predicted kinase